MMKDNLLYDPDLYVQSDIQVGIRKAFEKLPPKTREVFFMNRFDGKKTVAIALEMNISARTVETHITHALKILRDELKDYLPLILLF